LTSVKDRRLADSRLGRLTGIALRSTHFEAGAARRAAGRRLQHADAAGQQPGIGAVADGPRLVSFPGYGLGFVDLAQGRLQAVDHPFGTRLSPMS
jgi:hypothetical protein